LRKGLKASEGAILASGFGEFLLYGQF